MRMRTLIIKREEKEINVYGDKVVAWLCSAKMMRLDDDTSMRIYMCV